MNWNWIPWRPTPPCSCAKIVLVIGPVQDVGDDWVKPTPKYKKWPMLNREVLLAMRMTDSQRVLITIDPASIKDKKGNPATLDGAPVWLTDNTDLLALAPAEDGMSCMVSSLGPLGTGNVSCTADGAPGPDVQNVAFVVPFEISGGNATTISPTIGTPEEIPDPPPAPTPVAGAGS